jgi:MYXO-CTERM domain-containing protein
MKLASRLVASLLAMLPLALAAQVARADDPCGKFDFSDGKFDCKIQVEGGCSASCTPLKFEAGCTGGCTVSASTSCVDTCGTQCIQQCDPQLLDCFAGCHAECDEPVKQQCLAKGSDTDCVEQATAQCDVHCNDSCAVPPSNCQEHCQSCCTGGCVTQVNFDCDYQCFADLQGGCDVQCSEPSGALFCNGQYVFASDIDACITYLSNQGIEVDVSARGQVECDISGCTGDGTSTVCSVSSPGIDSSGIGGLGLVAFGLAFGVAAERRRRRSGKAS